MAGRGRGIRGRPGLEDDGGGPQLRPGVSNSTSPLDPWNRLRRSCSRREDCTQDALGNPLEKVRVECVASASRGSYCACSFEYRLSGPQCHTTGKALPTQAVVLVALLLLSLAFLLRRVASIRALVKHGHDLRSLVGRMSGNIAKLMVSFSAINFCYLLLLMIIQAGVETGDNFALAVLFFEAFKTSVPVVGLMLLAFNLFMSARKLDFRQAGRSSWAALAAVGSAVLVAGSLTIGLALAEMPNVVSILWAMLEMATAAVLVAIYLQLRSGIIEISTQATGRMTMRMSRYLLYQLSMSMCALLPTAIVMSLAKILAVVGHEKSAEEQSPQGLQHASNVIGEISSLMLADMVLSLSFRRARKEIKARHKRRRRNKKIKRVAKYVSGGLATASMRLRNKVMSKLSFKSHRIAIAKVYPRTMRRVRSAPSMDALLKAEKREQNGASALPHTASYSHLVARPDRGMLPSLPNAVQPTPKAQLLRGESSKRSIDPLKSSDTTSNRSGGPLNEPNGMRRISSRSSMASRRAFDSTIVTVSNASRGFESSWTGTSYTSHQQATGTSQLPHQPPSRWEGSTRGSSRQSSRTASSRPLAVPGAAEADKARVRPHHGVLLALGNSRRRIVEGRPSLQGSTMGDSLRNLFTTRRGSAIKEESIRPPRETSTGAQGDEFLCTPDPISNPSDAAEGAGDRGGKREQVIYEDAFDEGDNPKP